MTYTVIFEPKAQRELENLSSDISERIVRKLLEAQENPEHFLEKLEGMSEWKLRVGDYRVILFWLRNECKLKIQAVGHRKNIYKKYKTD